MMATFAASTALQEQCQKVRQRVETVRMRPTTRAAEEFFQDNDWQSLPRRLERLVQVLQAWVRLLLYISLNLTLFFELNSQILSIECTQWIP